MHLTESARTVKVRELNEELAALEASIDAAESKLREVTAAWRQVAEARAKAQDELDEADAAQDAAWAVVAEAEAEANKLEVQYGELLAKISELSELTVDGNEVEPEGSDD